MTQDVLTALKCYLVRKPRKRKKKEGKKGEKIKREREKALSAFHHEKTEKRCSVYDYDVIFLNHE